MTEEEAVALTRYVRALCPQQKFDDYTSDAWHDILGAFTLVEARTAAITIAGRQAFISPGEIATEIRKTRRVLVNADAETEPPPADPNNVPLYLRQLRTYRRNIASGYIAPTRELPAPVSEEDVAAMRQQKDLKAFIQQESRMAAARCAARVQLVARYPDLIEQVSEVLGHDRWNGYLPPEHDATGRINSAPGRTRLIAILTEAEHRA